jgi:uncharacterized repeat protein (TIGR01451 family)
MKTRDREKESREAIVLMLLILLVGVLCIILTSGWALRFRLSWQLPANMDSNLNPNSDIQTGVPVDLLEPLDPSILTNPAWFDVFLTPDASFATRPPLPTSTRTPLPTDTTIATNTSLPVITSSPTNTLLPTNTVIFIPPSTPTPRPPRPPRDTPTASPIPVTPTVSPIPVLSADLQISKTDNVGAYVTGGTLTYIITVVNNGPDAVKDAVVTDALPAQIATWDWVCTSQTGGASGCDGVAGSTMGFSDTVDLPVGGSITYTVTANISATAMGNLTNSATVSSSILDPVPGNNSATDMDTQFISADLSITKDDGVATYVPGGTLLYTIIVSNNSGSNVVGVVVTDMKPTQIDSWDWVCTLQTGGASGCDEVIGSNMDFSDIVDLPVGGSITYTVTANVSAAATGNLTNEAVVGSSADDPVPGNNRDADTDTP